MKEGPAGSVASHLEAVPPTGGWGASTLLRLCLRGGGAWSAVASSPPGAIDMLAGAIPSTSPGRREAVLPATVDRAPGELRPRFLRAGEPKAGIVADRTVRQRSMPWTARQG